MKNIQDEDPIKKEIRARNNRDKATAAAPILEALRMYDRETRRNRLIGAAVAIILTALAAEAVRLLVEKFMH